MYQNDQVTRRYSEAFKLKILAELSTGKYSKRELTRIYGLQFSTVTELTKKHDCGIQYCSNQYTNELLKRKIKISMTEEKHCYENAVAERVNGILKDQFYLN